MIYLTVIEPDRFAISKNCDVLITPVSYPGKVFCQMNSRVGVVSDTEQEDLPIQLVYAADWAVQSVGNINGMWSEDRLCERTNCRKSVIVVTAHHTRQPPE